MYQLLSDIQYRGKYASRQEIQIQRLKEIDELETYMNSLLSVTIYDVIVDHRGGYLVIHSKNDEAVKAAKIAVEEVRKFKEEERKFKKRASELFGPPLS